MVIFRNIQNTATSFQLALKTNKTATAIATYSSALAILSSCVSKTLTIILYEKPQSDYFKVTISLKVLHGHS